MIEHYLKAKHWQLFLLLVGIPLGLYFLFIAYLISSIAIQRDINPPIYISSIISYVSFFSIVWMGLIGGWYWSIATGLQKIIPKELQLNVKRFKICFIIPAIYISLFLAISSIFVQNPMLMEGYIGLIIPLHLMTMLCGIYCILFTAKTLKTAEMQQRVTFGNYISTFFMLWLFPFGIWGIQPKINALIKDKSIKHSTNSFLLDDDMF